MIAYKFCPCCGGKLVQKNVEHKIRLVCSKCEFVFYENSKPCVAAIIRNNGKVLLVERGIEPFRGDWDLPGGFLEDGEDPEVGLKRELMEELGLRAKIKQLMCALIDQYGNTGENTLNLFYLVEPVGEIKGASDDVSAYAFFPLAKLPRNIAFRSARQALRQLQNK